MTIKKDKKMSLWQYILLFLAIFPMILAAQGAEIFMNIPFPSVSATFDMGTGPGYIGASYDLGQYFISGSSDVTCEVSGGVYNSSFVGNEWGESLGASSKPFRIIAAAGGGTPCLAGPCPYQPSVYVSISGSWFRGIPLATQPIPPEIVAFVADPNVVTEGDSITFTAFADKPCTIQFSVRTPSGAIVDIGSAQTGADNSAAIQWTSGTEPGEYTAVAQTGNSTKETLVTVTSRPVLTSLHVSPIEWQAGGAPLSFTASANKPAQITFTLTTPNGTTVNFGTYGTGAGNAVSFTWDGFLQGATEPTAGDYTVHAQVGQSTLSAGFTIKPPSTGGGQDDFGTTGGGGGNDKDPVEPPTPPGPYTCKNVEPRLTTKSDSTNKSRLISDPVNPVNGNFVLAETDLQLQSRIPLTVYRVYNSLDTYKGPFGRGWSSIFFSRLEINATSVQFINSDGSGVLFRKNGNSYQGPDTTELKLVYSADTGFWGLTHPREGLWTFDSTGKILRMAGSCCGMGANDALLFEYDNNRLHRVTNPAGQWLELTYNQSGQIVSIVDSTNRRVAYTFDSAGNMVSFTNVISATTRYFYNSLGQMIRIEEPGNRVLTIAYANERVTSVTAPDGAVTTFQWASATRHLTVIDPVSTTHEYQFNERKGLTDYTTSASGMTPVNRGVLSSGTTIIGIRNAEGFVSSYTYWPDGLIKSSTDFAGQTSTFEWHPTLKRLTKKTDSLGRVWRYEWDSKGNLIREVDPLNGETKSEYDAFNNLICKTDSLGRKTRFIFDNGGNQLLNVIDAMGGISSFTYDNRGNIKISSDQLNRVTVFDYDLLNRLVKTVYPDGRFVELVYNDAGNVSIRRAVGAPGVTPAVPIRETRYFYDSSDRLTKLIRPDGTEINYAFNATGQKISETDSLGRVTRFEYSPLGLLKRSIYPDGSFETMAYDTESRLISKTNELGHTVKFQYNVLGQLVATIDPTGARWESQYDSAGRKTADKDPYNRVTAYQFDNLDRITKVIRPDNSFTTSSFDAVGNLLNTVDALGNRWSWFYDNLNRQIESVQPNGASSTTTFDAAGQVIAETDALGRTTRHSFDSGGRRTTTIDALNNVWRNFYDGAGRLIATKDPLNAVSSINYDIMDRVISQVDPLGNITKFEFDRAGRRVAKVDALNRRSITVYDLRDRVTSEVDPEGRTVLYSYDLAGRRVKLIDGANRIWRWEYDALGRVTTELAPLGNAKRTRYDAVGNAISVTNARNQTTNYLFDSMNRNYRIAYPDGTVATMAFDLEGRELVRSSQNGVTTKTWDSVGNLTSETFSVVGALLAAPGSLPTKTWRYSFDLVGNRIQAVDPEGQTYKYKLDNLNRLIELNPPKKGDEVKFVFDPAGRLVQEIRPGVKTTNSFDLAGRLLQVKHERDRGHDKTVALRRYAYSPVGNRLTMTNEENCTDSYFYDKSDWLTRVKYSNGVQVSYTFNGAGDRLTEKTETPTVKRVGRNVVRATDTMIIPFGYDDGGRMTSMSSFSIPTEIRSRSLKTVMRPGICGTQITGSLRSKKISNARNTREENVVCVRKRSP